VVLVRRSPLAPNLSATTVSAVLAALVALTALVGLAASLSVNPATIGGTSVAVGRCTATGLSVLPNLTGTAIVSVTVSPLPAACGNATLKVTVNNGLVNSSGSATVPAGGGSVTVPLAVATAVTTTVQTDLVLVGP
jgi:hypothetical protein